LGCYKSFLLQKHFYCLWVFMDSLVIMTLT
jgi:hypothetical protein